jgi:hypothetical protein
MASFIAWIIALGGVARADGISGYEEQTNRVLVGAGGFSNVSVSCSVGNKVVGGAFDVETPDDVKVYSSAPSDGSGNLIDHGWNVFVHNAGTVDRQVTATAICVSPTIPDTTAPEPGKRKTLDDLPPPVLGAVANVEPVKGTVLVALPVGTATAKGTARASQKGLRFVPLREGRQIPVGSFLDTRKGTVRLQSARDRRGTRQTGDFASGLFQMLQSRRASARGLTDVVLKGSSFRSCRASGRDKRASAALSRRTIRRLRANARGRFRTRGRHSAATTRGTVWLTADRCDGTLTRVKRGRVAVRDLRRKRTVVVRAGKSYLARAPR